MKIQKIVISALLIAVGVVLPRFFPFPAGMVFLPMHIPILLCGIICGLPYGLICGIITPLLSYLFFGMPQPPMLYAMVLELAAYGFFSALFIRIPAKELYMKIHFALIGAMLSGRIVYGLANAYIFNIGDYSMQGWLTAAFVTALPGILIQIVIIPPVVMAVRKVNK